MEKISAIEIRLFNPIENIKTIGNQSEKGSEKYKLGKNKLFKFGRFHIENTEEDMTKKNNKDKNDEETINDN